MKSIVWKTCLIASCEEDYVFSDLSVETKGGKTKFSKSSYSHGFWSVEALEILRNRSSGLSSKISAAFKKYVENQ